MSGIITLNGWKARKRSSGPNHIQQKNGKLARRSSKNYINNKRFTETISEWVRTEEVRKTKALRDEIEVLKKGRATLPVEMVEKIPALAKEYNIWYKKSIKIIPNYATEAFIDIANRIALKTNFSGYTYIDDMKGDALLLCVKYAYNFDPEKSSNAFAYFTQIVFNAFKQYLNKEKKQANQKFELTRDELQNSEKFNYNNIVNSNTNSDGDYIDPEFDVVIERIKPDYYRK